MTHYTAGLATVIGAQFEFKDWTAIVAPEAVRSEAKELDNSHLVMDGPCAAIVFDEHNHGALYFFKGVGRIHGTGRVYELSIAGKNTIDKITSRAFKSATLKLLSQFLFALCALILLWALPFIDIPYTAYLVVLLMFVIAGTGAQALWKVCKFNKALREHHY